MTASLYWRRCLGQEDVHVLVCGHWKIWTIGDRHPHLSPTISNNFDGTLKKREKIRRMLHLLGQSVILKTLPIPNFPSKEYQEQKRPSLTYFFWTHNFKTRHSLPSSKAKPTTSPSTWYSMPRTRAFKRTNITVTDSKYGLSCSAAPNSPMSRSCLETRSPWVCVGSTWIDNKKSRSPIFLRGCVELTATERHQNGQRPQVWSLTNGHVE